MNKKLNYGILEDEKVKLEVERIIKSKRGYIRKLPKKGEHVICQLSGGIDTFVVVGMLVKEYGAIVHPVFFNKRTKRTKKTFKAAKRVTQFLRQSFGDSVYPLEVLDVMVTPTQIQGSLMPSNGIEVVDEETGQRRGLPFQPAVYAFNCLHYAQFLEKEKDIKCRIIVGAHLPSNATLFAYETLTAFRIIMLELCASTRDWSWQYISLPLEEKLDKSDLIKWAMDHQFSLKDTWTCGNAGLFHCGVCICCGVRQEAFKVLGIQDNATYMWTDNPSIVELLRSLYRYMKHNYIRRWEFFFHNQKK